MTIYSRDYGTFHNFVHENETIAQNQILGSICMLAICDPVRSSMGGIITRIYNYDASHKLVDKGDPLYEISEAPQGVILS